jgi:hypothetical protein
MEVVGDELHVREPKHEQRESSDADEHEDHDDEARESIGREVSRATRLPPLLWGRFGVHPIRILRGERHGSRSTERAGEVGEDRRVRRLCAAQWRS